MVKRGYQVWLAGVVCENIFRLAPERSVHQHLLSTRGQTYMPSGVLRFSFSNEQITELLPVCSVKLDVGPFEGECLAQTQSRFEEQEGNISQRLLSSF